MTISELTALINRGEFHHATYRNQGTLWEGLWIYCVSPTGFRGYDVAGCFNKTSPELDAAFALVAGSGISVGSFGNG